MKKIVWVLLIICLLLSGCTGDPEETLMTTDTTLPQQTQASILDGASPWDEEGALLEIPLNIPDALHYTAALEFDGDLLLWNIDSHLPQTHILEMCVVDLKTGEVIGQKDVPLHNYCSPQVLGQTLYLCDNLSGEILGLDKSLETVRSWKLEPGEASWYMGGNDTLYVHLWDSESYALDLNTGEQRAILEEGQQISNIQISGESAILEYYRADNGKLDCLALNLQTGQKAKMPKDIPCHTASFRDGYWLCEYYTEGSVFYFGSDEEKMVSASTGTDTLRLLDDGKLLAFVEDGCCISLHDANGNSISRATLSAMPFSLFCDVVIPSENEEGYFLLVSDYSTSFRLLYWDTSHENRGGDIPFEPLPKPSEAEQQLLERAEEMERKYGVAIYFGSRAETEFYDFHAETVTDWHDISNALDVLDDALSVYPEGFFRQLRYGSIQGLRIHLVGTLESINPEEYVHNYVAFVQEEYDCHVMGVDIYQAEEQYYFHEISHVIDAYLEYEAAQRETAIFSEEVWNSLNPDWFPGYTYTYSWERELRDYSSFIDSYSTIKPTEDRARILQYAMVSWGESNFEDGSVLKNKLRYYCRCIRDAFDTTGWPNILPWEQFL